MIVIVYLALAVLSSALISVIMRLSSDRVKNNLSMLAMNYLTCMIMAGLFVGGFWKLFPQSPQLPSALGMGAVHGVLYLLSFMLFQYNVKKNGVVLSSVFMKLGLLVPMVVSILIFGEKPTLLQIVGFVVAVIAILIINFEPKKDEGKGKQGVGLVVLLLAGGAADGMSKIYEETGPRELSAQFLFYTFVVAFVLCVVLVIIRKQRIGKNEVLYGCLIGIPNFFSAKFLLASLGTVPAVIAYPTFSVATILVVTLSGVVIFRERLSLRQSMALAMILGALVMLNI